MKDDFTNGCNVPDDQKERHYDVFEEVALITHYLRRLGVLSEISERVHFARSRFGQYEVIDFVAVLLGYAVSSERTLEAFYERLQPFANAFMALFDRDDCLIARRSPAFSQRSTKPQSSLYARPF